MTAGDPTTLDALPESARERAPETAAEPPRAREPHLPARTLRQWLGGRRLRPWLHAILGLGLPLVLLAVAMWRVRAHTVDDAYITYRYARNLARGWGLVYNEGERIEGYTNFLFTLLLGGAVRLGLPAEGTAKVIGALSAGGALALLYELSRRLRPLRAVPPLAPWLCASTLVFGGYGVFGLETSLFVLLVLAGVLLFLREERRNSRLPWSGVVFGLAGLTRPEAPLYLGLFMLFLGGPPLVPAAMKRLTNAGPGDERARVPVLAGALACLVGIAVAVLRRQPAPSWLLAVGGIAGLAAAVALVGALPRRILERRNLLRGGVFVAIVGAHLVWRHAYYGSWVPNTLSAKTGDFSQQIAGGLDYFDKLVRHEGPVIYLTLLGTAVALLRRQAALAACAAVVLVGTVYVVIVGGDWMPLYRFFSPIMPFAYVLVDVGVRPAIERRHRFVNYGMLVLGIVTVAHRAGQIERDRKKVVIDERGFWDKAAGGTAQWFADREQRMGAERARGAIALGDIGQVGWETDYPIFDVLGLVEPVIGKLEGGYTRKTGPGYRDRFFEVKPRYFVMISAEGDCSHPSVPTSQALFRDSRFAREYYVAGTVRLSPQHNWCIWERKEFRPNPNP